jgi:hypothetical protein
MPDPIPQTRAGAYRRQQTGYRAFIPAPLPPTPALEINGELQSLLSQADQALGRLDGSIQTLPNPDLFVFMYVRKEAVLSARSKERKVPCRIFSPPKLNCSTRTGHAMSPRSSTMSRR